MLIKIHKTYRDVVAICDSGLIGKRFEEEKFQLDIKEDFFKGEEFSKEKAREIIRKMSKEDATFNIVGKESVDLALEEGIIQEEGIREIKGIKFAMVLL